jgi:hypothetical protein
MRTAMAKANLRVSQFRERTQKFPYIYFMYLCLIIEHISTLLFHSGGRFLFQNPTKLSLTIQVQSVLNINYYFSRVYLIHLGNVS